MKKHSHEEILLKLRQAEELTRAGKSQRDICKVLGVSVMTFHRWRKLPIMVKAKQEAPTIAPEQPISPAASSAADMALRLEELAIENRRLRKIVTDLMLEKMKIEESVTSIQPMLSSKNAVTNDV